MVTIDPKQENLPLIIRKLEKTIQGKKSQLNALEPSDNDVIDTRRVEEIQSTKLELLVLENECYSLKKFYLLTCFSKNKFRNDKKNNIRVTN